VNRLKNRGIVVLAVLGLFALSGIAMADSHEEFDPDDDTLVNHFIDYDAGFLVLNITSLDYSPDWNEMFSALDEDCRLADEAGYSLSFNGSDVTVNDSEGPVVLGDCGSFISGFFEGPNGQINKGMIMKFLNSIYEGPGRGCVIREFAQLEFDQENRRQADPEVDPAEASVEEPLLIEGAQFMSFETNCLHGNKGGNGGPPEHVLQKHAEKWGEGNKPGKPDHAGGPGGRP
jgi:hypothetical protein